MNKKVFSRYSAGIFVLILFVAFLSSCKQNSTTEEGLLTTDSENSRSISQTETPAAAALYVPAPIIEFPTDLDPVYGTLTPTFLWFSVPGATKYQISIYWVITASGKKIRLYTSPLLDPQIDPYDNLQSFKIPAGILNYGTEFGYSWWVRARIGAYSSEYSWAEFQVYP